MIVAHAREAFLGLHGPIAIVVQVLLLFLLYGHVLALVHYAETHPRRTRRAAAVARLLVPVYGPLRYAQGRRRDHPARPHGAT